MNLNLNKENPICGILLVDKPKGKTSFQLVAALRRILHVKRIGHAGTLDPFATGVMVMLIGREYTKLSGTFLNADKEYLAQMHLGVSTDSFDCDGVVTAKSDLVPTIADIETVVAQFQGEIEQIPPMFSAKKVQGKKLYELARKGKTVERQPVKINVEIEIVSYNYPYLEISVKCSKGTYIRSLAHDIGSKLGCGAHLSALQRTRSGNYSLDECLDGVHLFSQAPQAEPIISHLLTK